MNTGKYLEEKKGLAIVKFRKKCYLFFILSLTFHKLLYVALTQPVCGIFDKEIKIPVQVTFMKWLQRPKYPSEVRLQRPVYGSEVWQ